MKRAAKVLLRASLVLVLGWPAGCELLTPAQAPQLAARPLATLRPPALATSSAGQSPARIQQASYPQPATLPPTADDVQPAKGKRPLGDELTVEAVVQEVLARNPTLAQMVAGGDAASARYPQVTSLDDPMVDLALAPASFGSNNVEAGYRVGISQKYPLSGKVGLRGQVALA